MRRRALLCLALPASLAARQAAAWRETAASAPVAQAWADRCGALPQAASGAVTLCPFCGCPVVGARDHGEAGALPPG